MIRNPSQARRKQHPAVNRQDTDRVVKGSDNENKELTSLLNYFSFVLFISFSFY